MSYRESEIREAMHTCGVSWHMAISVLDMRAMEQPVRKYMENEIRGTPREHRLGHAR